MRRQHISTIYHCGCRYEQLNPRLHAHDHNVGVKRSRLCRSSMSAYLNPDKNHVCAETMLELTGKTSFTDI